MEETTKTIKGKTKLGHINLPPEDENEQPEIVENMINIDAETGEPIEKEVIISSYGTFNNSGPQKIRIRRGKEMKNTSKFLLEAILKMYYICLWKKQATSMKYAQRGYNAQRANFKKMVRNLSNVINNHQFNYLDEIFEKMKKNAMPSGIKHDPNYWKLKIVDNDKMDKKCLDKLLLWSDLLPKKKRTEISKVLKTLFTKMSQNKKPKINNNNYIKPKINNNNYIKPKNNNNYIRPKITTINDYNNKGKNNYINNNYNYNYNRYVPRYEQRQNENYYLTPDKPRVVNRSQLIDKTRDVINRVKVVSRVVKRPNNNYYATSVDQYENQNSPIKPQYNNNIIYLNKPGVQNIAYTNHIRNSTYEMDTCPYRYQNYVINKPKVKDNYRFYESQYIGNNRNYKNINDQKQNSRKIKVKYISKGNPNEYFSPIARNPYLLQYKNQEEPDYTIKVSPYQVKRNIIGNKARNYYGNVSNKIKTSLVKNYYAADEDEQFSEANFGRSFPTKCRRCGGIIQNNYNNYNNYDNYDNYRFSNFGDFENNFRLNSRFQSIQPENRYNNTNYCYDYLYN